MDNPTFTNELRLSLYKLIALAERIGAARAGDNLDYSAYSTLLDGVDTILAAVWKQLQQSDATDNNNSEQ